MIKRKRTSHDCKRNQPSFRRLRIQLGADVPVSRRRLRLIQKLSYRIENRVKAAEGKRTALVIREVFDTHRDSTFALFQEVIEELGLTKAVATLSSQLRCVFKTAAGSCSKVWIIRQN